jgi:hypothetical protein
VFSILSRTALAVVLGAGSTVALAQVEAPAVQASPTTVTEPLPPIVKVVPATINLPALTIVELTVLDEVSSKTAISGQPVRLALASPLYVTSDLGLPARTLVEGFVIHAAKGGMGGKSGELLIGAKRIALSQTTEIPLRSFKLGPARGKNNETLAFATTVAAGAVGGVAAMFITGGSAKAPAGAIASAKTAADVSIPLALLTKLPARLSSPAVLQAPPQSSAVPTTTTQGNSK